MKQQALDKFLRYVRVNTQSKDGSESFPSTADQFDLAYLLVDELKSIGLSDAQVDEFGYVTASIPATCNHEVPVVGFLAHLDTSPELSGSGVNPQVIDTYTGGDIVINKELNVVLRAKECVHLNKCLGHTIVTSDGTTLLGADDKAGIAAIMTMAEILVASPGIQHGLIKIAFTPDEEVGRGVDHFNLKGFGADYAYTVDGGMPGELNKETFSANAALIEVKGRNIHPGSAKNIMINAIRVIGEIVAMLPKEMRPETTENYEPFIHPTAIKGGVEKTQLKLILRDFDTGGLQKQKEILQDIIKEVRYLYPKAKISLTITETYRNMREEIEKRPLVTDNLWRAVEGVGLVPEWKPIRGGTDGSKLTAMGLPTPNIFNGSNNVHSRSEWLSVDAMVKSIETMLLLVKIYAEQAAGAA